MLLRDVVTGDLQAYVAMRCDPAMMGELGGPQDPSSMCTKVGSDVVDVLLDRAWVSMIVPDATAVPAVAGGVALWRHEHEGSAISEIGWMVLPEYQGRGLATAAVRALLHRARTDGRWGDIHAFPGVTNVASNSLCRRLGFVRVATTTVTLGERPLDSHHWRLAADLQPVYAAR
jgi:RimJ/RimL family protein N-acetyltransferase